MAKDEDILLAALKEAAIAYDRERPRGATLLSGGPDEAIVGPLAAEIEKCSSFKAVAGQVLFSGGGGPVLHSNWLASNLFSRGVQYRSDIPGAVAWLLKLLTTRAADGIFKAAIWGLGVKRLVETSNSWCLLPFAALQDSYIKWRITERAKPLYDGSAWISQRFFDAPKAAFIKKVPNFPYIHKTNESFIRIARLEQEIRELGALIQASSVGHPLAVACWFEYEDCDLEVDQWASDLTWLLPEINPYVMHCANVDTKKFKRNADLFHALQPNRRVELLRSMERFQLSQCRHHAIDRVLDLALAFEIAVSETDDNAPASWKVSVRAAQLIGGPLARRQAIRSSIGALYALRNKATHGSGLKSKTKKTIEDLLRENAKLYMDLINRILMIKGKPDWKAIELEPVRAIRPYEKR